MDGEPGDEPSPSLSTYGDLERPPLSETALRRALIGSGSRWTELRLMPEAGSTNAVATEALTSSAAGDGLVVVAEHQSAGRGRLGRAWESPPRAGITVSAVVQPQDVPAARWSWVPLLTGLAVGAVVQRTAQVDARLKWPNDVVVDDRKLGGILVERVESPTGPLAVIGIGLNVSQQGDELPTDDATSLALEHAETVDRTVLLKAILRSLDGLLARWEASGGDVGDLRAAYLDACATLGRHVRVTLPGGETVEGVAETVDETGRLVVHEAGGHARPLGAGDVLHLRPQT